MSKWFGVLIAIVSSNLWNVGGGGDTASGR